jgi:hypothetical protein
MRKFRAFLAPLFLTLFYTNCSLPSGSEIAPLFPFRTNAHYYFQQIQALNMEVYYEPTAQPYTGNTVQGRPYWGIVKENLIAIFQYRSQPPAVNVPTTLAQMTQIPAQNKSAWTNEDILALAETYRQQLPDDANGRFYIYFVRGYYNDGSGPNQGVIGVHINTTPIVMIFKDVIENSGQNPNGPAAKFMEQSTLVHELGHALGFVNLDVPMVTPHEDLNHPGHTTNSNCVMYWLNEGTSDLAQFVQQYLVSNSVVMWGPEVKADAQAVSN